MQIANAPESILPRCEMPSSLSKCPGKVGRILLEAYVDFKLLRVLRNDWSAKENIYMRKPRIFQRPSALNRDLMKYEQLHRWSERCNDPTSAKSIDEEIRSGFDLANFRLFSAIVNQLWECSYLHLA